MKNKIKIEPNVLSELISKGFQREEAERLNALQLNIQQTISNLRSFALSWAFAMKRNPDDFVLSSRAKQSIKQDYDALMHLLSDYFALSNLPLLRELKASLNEIGCDL